MNAFFPFVVFMIAFLSIAILVRKDKDEQKILTKRGWVKLGLSLAVVFVLVASFVVLSN
ncbi:MULTISPECIES: DUF3976 domain-containing protein [Cytobacillus]|uniref:DUF3976 domain-containing protein n=1 Tax=Cytobacillus stercorigallinarum TaxID=2762240 RepID=A0ABR8QU07_9BACI|nr:DUF3976 domain-containing protein [Cytobacillus stercorigallinarum]MBD7938983.1 DUF3976 domain-containing protein [Cytobacillus stercorigallinarum]